MKEIYGILSEGRTGRHEPFALARLVRAQGSSYRRPGARVKEQQSDTDVLQSFSAEKLFEGLEEFVREAGCFSAKIIELLRELQFLAAVNFTGDGRYSIGG
jgi:hypothetical protein